MTDSDNTETAVWERARRDEGDAFGILFDLHHDRVYRRALGLMANTHDAEDVTAAAFFELWRNRLQRHQRRARGLAFGVGALVLAGATTGAAVVANNLPGTTTVAAVGSIVGATHTGTASVDLGPVPANASVVVVDLSCVSAVGRVSLRTVPPEGEEGPAGSGLACADGGTTLHVADGLLPRVGTTSITIKADPGTTWHVTAQYATSSTTAWGVNARGQSYGVANAHGIPDLSPAQATNGKRGHIVTKELTAMDQSGYIDVYESDGTTVIGKYRFSLGENIPVDTSKLPLGLPTDGDGK